MSRKVENHAHIRRPICSFCLKSIRAAALDDGEPTGKSPGRGAESVAGRNGVLLELCIVFDLLIVLRCCDYSLRKPNRELAITSVHFEFFLRHALEQFV
jgi:hypothetical protein